MLPVLMLKHLRRNYAFWITPEFIFSNCHSYASLCCIFAIVPDLLSIDEPVQQQHPPYAFKKDFDEPRCMASEDTDGNQIIVTIAKNASVVEESFAKVPQDE